MRFRLFLLILVLFWRFATAVAAADDPALLAKAQAYEAWLRTHHVPGYGGVVNVVFETPELQNVLLYRGQGDSTMWTATYCAAESFRYAVTGEIEAKDNAVAAVHTLRDHLRVTQTPGYIGRYVGPVSDPAFWLDYVDSDLLRYGEGAWLGTFYLSNSSSDQYVGWFHGLAVAYDLIDDAPLRALIREMVAEVIDALEAHRWLILNEEGLPTTAAPGIDGSERLTFCLIAAHILDEQYYWDLYAEQFEDAKPTLPFKSIAFWSKYTEYFANNLRHQNHYNLFRLETDPERLAFYWDVFNKRIRRWSEWTHNVYYDFVYLSGCERGLPCAEAYEIMTDAVESLTAFQEPPNRESHVDCPLLPVDPLSATLVELAELLGLSDLLDFELQTAEPHEIADRCRVDFLWQRTPYHRYCIGYLDQSVFPGVDYLLAYWMGRYHGYLEPHDIVDDDTNDDDSLDDDAVDDDVDDDGASDDDHGGDDDSILTGDGDDDNDDRGCAC